MYEILVTNNVNVESPTAPYEVEVQVNFEDERFKNRLINICKRVDMRITHKRRFNLFFNKGKSSIVAIIYQNDDVSLPNNLDTSLAALFEKRGVYGFSNKIHAQDFGTALKRLLTSYIDEKKVDYNKLLVDASDLS